MVVAGRMEVNRGRGCAMVAVGVVIQWWFGTKGKARRVEKKGEWLRNGGVEVEEKGERVVESCLSCDCRR